MNRELIKQNFRFQQPIIGSDDELEESKDEGVGFEINGGQQAIDPNKTSRRDYFFKWDAIGIDDDLNKEDQNEYDESLDQIIIPSVDPTEWYKEFNRVKKYIDMELDSHGNVINKNQTEIKKNLIEISDIDDLLDKIEAITLHFNVVKEFMYNGPKRQLETMIDHWTASNDKIQRYEK